MLINFFHGLKDAGVPVTPRELLDLLEGMTQHIAFGSMDEFYYFSRTCMVKDEKYLPTAKVDMDGKITNENIDVINFTDNLELYIRRALSPAKIENIKVAADDGRVSVYLKPDQVSLASGKGGHNIKLASKLVGLEIDVFRDLQGQDIEEDVELEEFADEIESWVIDEFKRIGLDTARSILSLSREDLDRRIDLEEETINTVLNIIKQEFE